MLNDVEGDFRIRLFVCIVMHVVLDVLVLEVLVFLSVGVVCLCQVCNL